MATIQAGTGHFDVQCIVFDKDGTLIDFDQTWSKRAEDWIVAMVDRVPNSDHLAQEISRTVGYDWQQKIMLPEGPMVVTTALKLVALAAGEIYKAGLPWHDAEALVIETIIPTLGADFEPHEILPLGDVLGTFRRMKEAGLAVAIATGDDRKPTGEILDILGLRPFIDIVVCGNDDLPEKPDAAVLQSIGRQLGIDPQQMLMVGDSVNDMRAGHNAGAAGCIGITGSTGDAALLQPFADALLERVDQIIVLHD